ncbi:MFS siderochrome iron transporter 1 [Ascosphaera aggregata]|nr:MFS siderochrome iron transporter 1 [Ascosphaera aggregata]
MASACGEPHSSKNVIPFWRQVADPGAVTDYVINYSYEGSGTQEDPYAVVFLPNDPRNPMRYTQARKWFITLMIGLSTLGVAMISSAYTGGIDQIMVEMQIDQEVAILGVSLFVFGFAIGPLIWAPLSEMYGRAIVFFISYMGLTAFNAGCAGAKNAQTLLILRFFAGSFGSSPLTNAGGVIADMFNASQRGIATSVFALMPFLGPILGPIIGGFLGMTKGWRWVEGFLAIFSGALWITCTLVVPETYAPVLLRKRAKRLSKITGKHYMSKTDIERGVVSIGQAMKASLGRPWVLLFREPIVLLLSIYLAIIYGTLYMMFEGFPIVFQIGRGWNPGVGGLAFIGILVGMLAAMGGNLIDNKRYARISDAHDGFAPPEARLPPCIVGGIALPIGLFWFAWTNYPSVHWIVPIIAGAPFGFGMVLVFLGVMNYLIDSYTIYAASVLAANSVMRSICGAAFPLFTTYMYQDLGNHWASSIPAFLAVACIPMPLIFYKYGFAIRRKCKYAAEAEAFMRKMQDRALDMANKELQAAPRDDDITYGNEENLKHEPRNGERSSSDLTLTAGEAHMMREESSQLKMTRTNSLSSHASRVRDEYEGNPYDIDRVHTNTSSRRSSHNLVTQ